MTTLFDASGRPITAQRKPTAFDPHHAAQMRSQHRRGAQPRTGNAFGHWAGQDLQHINLPGGGALMFDLSALTTQDFRQMRYHPQVNISLSILNFMLRQIDWRITPSTPGDPKAQKIADAVEENLRTIWPQMVGALSQAYWAGYSPTVIDWHNNPKTGYTEIQRFKDLVPEDCEVNWKEVKGWAPPGRLAPKYKEYDGIQQYGMGWAIPVENTLWYPLMMENGDYEGHKLLKAAFMPWYFSILIHLFANRYYERFGEPTPIGRAPYDSEVVTPDGNIISGKTAMEQIMENLRSRGVVTLPSDRDPMTKEFEYTLDYMESQMRGVDFDRYMDRLDDEIGLALFTPRLMVSAGGVGSNSLGVQHTQCVHPDTMVLCADLAWRPAGKLSVGQEIVAFDEGYTPGGRGKNARSYRTAVIEANEPSEKDSVKIETDLGNPITMSVDHPCLVWVDRRSLKQHGTGNPGLIWKDAGDLVLGDRLAFFGSPWQSPKDYTTGWMAGMWDGEGCLAINTSNHGASGRGIELCVVQNPGITFDKMKQILTDDGFQLGLGEKGTGNQRIRINGGFYETMRCMGTYQPVRLLEGAHRMWEGRGLRRGQSFDLATVTTVTRVGRQPVASIQTSTGTFITEGYLTHNTFMWLLNGLFGDLKYYIDEHVLKRWKSINFSPNAPDVEWSFRKMGKESQETIRAIISQVISSGRATVDLEELGQAVGMTVTEVQETRDDPDRPSGTGAEDLDRIRDDKKSEGQTAIAGEPRATGRKISARVASQVTAAWRRNAFDSSFTPSFGYDRRMVEALVAEGFSAADAQERAKKFFARLDVAVRDVASISDSFDGPADVMALVDRYIDLAIGEMVS